MNHDDMALLREYAASQSESAFAALVARHIALIHSTALRQVGDAHLAQEITQAVFIILAREAGSLGSDTVLSAWLYRATRYAAADAMRTQRRRTQREQEAFMQSTMNESPSGAWEQFAPLLDEAMGRLGERDQSALVLRYFENKTAPEMAATLNLNEEAAQKRVTRALGKLRKFFAKRGVVLSAATIASAISANAVLSAPAGLAATMSLVAAKSAVASATVTALVNGTMKTMAWLKLQWLVTAGTAAVLVAGATAVALSQTSGDAPRPRDSLAQLPQPPVVLAGADGAATNVSPAGPVGTSPTGPISTGYSSREDGLQRAFLQFPLLEPATNSAGEPDFQTLQLTNPVVVAGSPYYGFRFTVPPGARPQDFDWAFVEPAELSWDILPPTGSIDGVPDFSRCAKADYLGAKALSPLNSNRVILQSYPGTNLVAGQTYLMWFDFEGHSLARISLAFTFADLPPGETNQARVLQQILGFKQPASRPMVNPENHHTYILLPPATWKKSEAEAVALGGHLATVRNQAEEDWIFNTFGHFGGTQRLLWVGLSDQEKKFHFSWSSGESVSYTAWAKHEPNNAGLHGEDFVAIYYPNHDQKNKWNDWSDRKTDPIGLPIDGVVEIIPDAAPPAADISEQAGAVPIGPNVVITSASGSINLQWPASAAGYLLEATTNLSQPFTTFGYSELTNLQTEVIYVAITNPVPQMYFRLQKP